jgi:hypothetical protein
MTAAAAVTRTARNPGPAVIVTVLRDWNRSCKPRERPSWIHCGTTKRPRMPAPTSRGPSGDFRYWTVTVTCVVCWIIPVFAEPVTLTT